MPASFSISGTVTDKDGQGLAGVEVSDGQGQPVHTDESGFYSIDGLVPGDYQVRASLAGFELIPYFRAVHVLDENVTGVNFYPRQAPQPEYINPQPLPVNHPPRLADVAPPAGGEMESQAITQPGQPGTAYALDDAWQVGVTGEPYTVEELGSIAHLNAPTALALDNSSNLWEAEEHGNRLVAFNASTLAPQLKIGDRPGISLMDDYTFNSLMAVAFQPHTNFIWAGDSTRLVKYDVLAAYPGQYVLQVPASDPWKSGIGNDHFSEVRGIAFDPTGETMFVADRFNHRIQVYDVHGSTLAYLRSLGVGGYPGNDSTHFNQPWHLFYFDGYVYVADLHNQRIQKCPVNGSPCSTVAGTGQAGYELNQLNTPTAVTISNAKMYIADAYNQRILRCDYDSRLDSFVSNCQVFAGVTGEAGSDASHLRWPADVLAQGSLIYVADRDNQRILKFTDTDSLPPTLNTQLGTTGEAYPVDPTLDPHTHVNQPWGMAVDAMDQNALYVAENWGYSLAKFYTTGENSGKLAWRVPAGAGSYGSDLHQFGNFSGSNQGNLAVDSLHRIFVPDAGNQRVMVYKEDGAIFGQIGAGQPGSGPDQFACPNGVGISHAYIFVADTCNQRIQIFDLSFKYAGTIGQTGVAGADSYHFSNPVALAVDAENNNIFVVDQGNQRVQRCHADGASTSFICAPFAGVSGRNAGRDFHYLNHPVGVAFDPGTRTVLISEEETSRVQVFNAGDGSYLTTISGEWGDAGGRVRMPSGLATDGNGWAYVADSQNARILRFSPSAYPWTQVNLNGFGSPYNQDVSGLTNVKVLYQSVFTEMLYALTSNPRAGPKLAQVWRQLPDYSWQAVSDPGFGSLTNYGLSDMAYFNNSLYVGTYDSRGAQIWRCKNLSSNPCEKPSDWNLVPGPLAASPHNQMVGRMVVFNGKLFVSYLNWSGASPTTTDGGEVWAYDGKVWDSNFLKLDATTTNAGHAISGMRALAASSDGTQLYAGTTDYLNSPATPAQLYRYAYNAGLGTWEWRRLKDNGITDPNNLGINSLLDVNGYLYVGTTNSTHGAMLYRYKAVDLSEETPVISGGLNSPQNVAISAMAASVDRIYALTSNDHSGIQVLSAPISGGVDGAWSLLSIQYGFGNATNHSLSSDSSLTFSPDGHLMAGAHNDANGGSLWLYSPDRAYHVAGHILYSGAELTHIIITLQPSGWTTSPNDSGEYIFENLLPGAYTLSAQYPLLGFSSPVQMVTIQSESIDGVDFTVASGGINLTRPSNGAQLTSLDPLTLQWDPVIGATSYSLQVAYVDSFSPLLKSVTQSATTFKLAGLSANKTYYWKVRKANGTPGPWSVTFSFKPPCSSRPPRLSCKPRRTGRPWRPGCWRQAVSPGNLPLSPPVRPRYRFTICKYHA